MNEINKKRIGVLTSGGDAPGMNAAIRGVYAKAAAAGYEVIGIRDGYSGLLREDMYVLTEGDMAGITSLGGTILGTSRCEAFHEIAIQEKAADILRSRGIKALVVIGGDGSFCGALRLYAQGISVIGIPGTIDLDIACTEYTLGFDTAVNAVIDSIDRIGDSTKSHSCYSVVEVMGRRAGYIAMWSGIAGGAGSILIPEEDKTRDVGSQLLKEGQKSGVIVLAEGAGHADELAAELERTTGIHTRANVLGFLQRGGSPSAKDRVYGCEMGVFAVEMIEKGLKCHVTAVKNGRMEAVSLMEALSMEKKFPDWLLKLGETMSHAS